MEFSYCHFLVQLFLLTIFIKLISTKCTLEKQRVKCFGRAWKQDLLPIENNSVEKLYISKCTESKPQSEVVDINFLKNMFKLTLLSMTNCEFTQPPLLYYQINSVTSIDLSNNHIGTNTQFPALGLNFFKQFPNLKVLNLTNNKLRHFHKSWFNCPSQLETIILDGNMIGGFSPSLADCFIKLKHLSLKRNSFDNLRMPSTIKRLSKVGRSKESGGLKIINSQNNFIRMNNGEDSSKGEKLSRIRQDNFGVIPHFQSLEILDLSHNNIQSIDQIPLSNLRNLYKINLSHNKLSSITGSSLNENKCDFGTAPFFINGKSGIIELDLSGNLGLTRIHSCWTFGLQNLRILKISNCSISSIYDSSFDKMKTLTVLDLSYNKLDMVPKEIIVVSKSLTWLNLAHNNINQMTSSFLSFLENLRTLNLSHNQYQSLIAFSAVESENKLSDFTGDFQTNIRESGSEEPINLFGQMRYLQDIDLSHNDLTKISASSDLSPAIKSNGELRRIDLRGNPSMSQFLDFNEKDITITLTEVITNEDLKFDCDCRIVGFIKWIINRKIKITGRCATPKHLSDISISNPQLVALIDNDKQCQELTNTGSLRSPYRLKLSSNANLSLGSLQTENDPMDNNQKRSNNQKRQIDNQKWIMNGMNLTMRCEFYSTYPTSMQVTIEWQRLQLKPFNRSHYSKQDRKQNSNPLYKNEKIERVEDIKYIEKIEHLSSNYDSRITTVQIGPVDEETVIDNFSDSEKWKNISPKNKGPPFKYVSLLLLKPVHFRDVGRYRCVVSDLSTPSFHGQNQLISKEENIKVFTPPLFTTVPSNPMAINEGDTAEITCRAFGNPPPMTSLGKIGSKDFPAARGQRMMMFKDDSSFFITNVRKVDAGNYSCTSRNAAGTISYNFTLKVQMRAQIINRIQPRKFVIVGEPLIIEFKVEGVPRPTIKWFKDNHLIVENDRVKFSADQLMLILQSTIPSDAGIYKMTVFNAFGGNNGSVSVNILDRNGQGSLLPQVISKDNPPPTSTDREPAWMPDYWLSGIIIIVILSILTTSILWISIFVCFSRIMSSKKKRLLLMSHLQTKAINDKKLTTATTTFSNPKMLSTAQFKIFPDCSIALSATSSTVAPLDTHLDDYDDNIGIDTFVDGTHPASDLYSTESLLNTPYSNGSLHKRPFLSTSRVDMSPKVRDSTSPYLQHQHPSDLCDSGIDSSQIYSETLNSFDTPFSVYQCRHKSKHRSKNYQKPRQRYMCSNSGNIGEVVKSKEADSLNSEYREKLQSEGSSNDSLRSGCHGGRSPALISVSVHSAS